MRVEEAAQSPPCRWAEDVEVAAQVGLIDEVVGERARVVQVVHGVLEGGGRKKLGGGRRELGGRSWEEGGGRREEG